MASPVGGGVRGGVGGDVGGGVGAHVEEGLAPPTRGDRGANRGGVVLQLKMCAQMLQGWYMYLHGPSTAQIRGRMHDGRFGVLLETSLHLSYVHCWDAVPAGGL